MTQIELSKYVGKICFLTNHEIDNAVIWTHAAIQGIEEKRQDSTYLNSVVFPVLSRQPAKTVFRDEHQMRIILSDAICSKLYWSVLVYLVSRVESAIGDVLREFLRTDPRRFLIGASGKKIDFRVILESGSYPELIEHLIANQLHEISYLRPSEQFDYFKKVTEVVLEPEVIEEWLEIKATRDILVHNNGVANQIYLTKAGERARAVDGDQLPIDAAYFERAVIAMKRVIGGTGSLVQSKLKSKVKSTKLKRGAVNSSVSNEN